MQKIDVVREDLVKAREALYRAYHNTPITNDFMHKIIWEAIKNVEMALPRDEEVK